MTAVTNRRYQCQHGVDLDGCCPTCETNERLGYDADVGDPKQYCKHGTFVGNWWGPDYLCGPCEDGVSVCNECGAWDSGGYGALEHGQIRWNYVEGRGILCDACEGLPCRDCGGQRWFVSTRDDGFEAIERCDACSAETLSDEDAALIAAEQGVRCELTYPCYVFTPDYLRSGNASFAMIGAPS